MYTAAMISGLVEKLQDPPTYFMGKSTVSSRLSLKFDQSIAAIAQRIHQHAELQIDLSELWSQQAASAKAACTRRFVWCV